MPVSLKDDGPTALCRRRVLPPVLPLTTGRTTVRRLAFVNLCVYLSQKVHIFISFITLFPDPGTGRRVYWRPEHSRRDRNAGTNVTKLPGQTSYMNSHSRTPGQRVGRDTHAGTWIMDIVIAWPHTI